MKYPAMFFVAAATLGAFALPAPNRAATVEQTVAVDASVPQPPTAAAQPDELQLPAIPANLRQPAERAAYLIRHFWDNLDFGDPVRARNELFMEQNFANFISVFPHAAEPARRDAVEILLRRAAADSTAYALVAEIAERYLYNDDSPLRSEEYYILFLEQLAESPVLGEYGTLRPRYQLEAARKNRPGMVAADFDYTTPDGRRASLHTTPAGERLLVVFYDPDCAHCKEVMARLQAEPLLTEAVAAGRMQVLALYSGDRSLLWRNSAAQLPADWTVGYNTGDIYDRELYVLRNMPTLYLLDGNRRVLLKEPTPEALIEWLREQ